MDNWIRLTLTTSGEPLYVRADLIETLHLTVSPEDAYTVVDTHSDYWHVKESPEKIIEQIRKVQT